MNKENTVTLKITPRNIYSKNPDQRLCRLCGKVSKRFSKIFSKPGKSKCLQHQIFLTTGINILETDNVSDTICRNCERFIESVVTFSNECFKTQHTYQHHVQLNTLYHQLNRSIQQMTTTIVSNQPKRA